MYSYHNRIRQRIRAGELQAAYFRSDYPGIGECLVLAFSTAPFRRPIRPHAYHKYLDILPMAYTTQASACKRKVETACP